MCLCVSVCYDMTKLRGVALNILLQSSWLFTGATAWTCDEELKYDDPFVLHSSVSTDNNNRLFQWENRSAQVCLHNLYSVWRCGSDEAITIRGPLKYKAQSHAERVCRTFPSSSLFHGHPVEWQRTKLLCVCVCVGNGSILGSRKVSLISSACDGVSSQDPDPAIVPLPEPE